MNLRIDKWDLNDENLETVDKALELWRENRGLTREGQRALFLHNSMSGLQELENANHINDIVDALCDMYVVLCNSFKMKADDIISRNPRYYSLEELVYDQALKVKLLMGGSAVIYRDKRGFLKKSGINYFKDLIKAVNLEDTPPTVYAFVLLKCLAILSINPYKALLETCEELLSREQDPEQKARWEELKSRGETPSDKWEKNPKQPEDTKYTADYKSCLIVPRKSMLDKAKYREPTFDDWK